MYKRFLALVLSLRVRYHRSMARMFYIAIIDMNYKRNVHLARKRGDPSYAELCHKFNYHADRLSALDPLAPKGRF